MTFRITGRSHRSAASACLSLAVLATIAVPAGAAADALEPVNVVAVVESGDGLEVIEFASTDPEGLVDLLDGVDTVVAVEPDGEWMPTQGTDTYRHLQTNLTQINAQPGRSAGGVIVAVLDSGVAAHADLPAMAPGYNAVDNNTNLTPTTDHGTNVAGAITAITGNGIGLAAVGEGITIMPVTVCGVTSCSYADVAEGIVWATDNGAQVINLSLGGGYSSAAEAAVAYATAHNVVIVAAGGNTGVGANPTVYPAALPDVIGVGATTAADGPTSWASFGSWIDLAAPGEAIATFSRSGSGYVQASGTSFSAPQVAAAAALLRAAVPTSSSAQIRSALVDSARDVNAPGVDPQTGAGSLDIGAALALLETRAAALRSTPDGASTVAGATSIAQLVSATDYRETDADTLRLYRAFLGREPDLGGAKFWIQSARAGATADDIAWSFSSSTEFSTTYGSNLTDARFLEIVYQNVLGRGYDQAGFEYWLGILRSGTPRFGAVRWIAAAPEFVNLYPYR